jgi:subtilisin family serine protease
VQASVLERFRQGARQARVIVTYRVPELEMPHALHFDRPERTLALRALRDTSSRLASVLAGQTIHHRYESVNAMAVTVDANALEALRAQPDVESVILDQGGSGHLLEAVPLSRLDVVQATGLTGAGVTVAVIDSGIDRTHPDLSDSLAAEACFCSGGAMGDGTGCCPNGQESQQGPGAAADDNGHGTNVIGIVTSNGTVAPKGGAPGARIVAVKVLDAQNAFTFSSDVVAGLDWVINNHPEVKVVNASLGTFALQPGTCDAVADAAPWKTAIDTLRANGALVFASSGNQSSSTGMAIPACVANTVAVGAVWDSNVGSQGVFCTEATTAADKITCFTNSDSALDLLAPGAPITSTGLGGGTSTFYGTSQASPLSAACAALLLERNSALTPSQIETALKGSPTRITDGRNALTFPRLDCGDALSRIGTANPDRTEGGMATGTGTPCNSATETVVKAYDNLMTSTSFSKWCVAQAPSTSAPISTVYDFAGTTAFAITSYTITTGNDVPVRDPKDWQFQGCQGSCTVLSDAGWVTLDTRTGQFAGAARFQTNTYSLTNTTAFQQYRLRFTANNGSTSRFQVAEIQMFGEAGSCTPESDAAFCSRLGKNCGTVTANDNCGASRTVSSCGTCTSPQTCGGAGTANVCGTSCTPESDGTFCSRLGKNCGTATANDNCGASRTVSSCGTCTSPQTCGGGGTANVCGGGSGPACATPYAQADCLSYLFGTRVSSSGHNWTCSNGNCANCAGFASCAPGGTGCPWGIVWTDDGPCQ